LLLAKIISTGNLKIVFWLTYNLLLRLPNFCLLVIFMIVVIASDITYNLEPFAKKLAVSLGAVYRALSDDFLLKNTGFFEEQKQGKIVLIGQAIASKLKVPALKIYLKESEEAIIARLSKEKKLSLEQAKTKHQELLKIEKEKINKLYGIDLNNLEIYDLIMRIDNLDQKAIISIIEKFIVKSTH